MHKLLEWLRRSEGDAPPAGPVDAEDVEDELPEEIEEGYEGKDTDA